MFAVAQAGKHRLGKVPSTHVNWRRLACPGMEHSHLRQHRRVKGEMSIGGGGTQRAHLRGALTHYTQHRDARHARRRHQRLKGGRRRMEPLAAHALRARGHVCAGGPRGAPASSPAPATPPQASRARAAPRRSVPRHLPPARSCLTAAATPSPNRPSTRAPTIASTRPRSSDVKARESTAALTRTCTFASMTHRGQRAAHQTHKRARQCPVRATVPCV